MVTHHEIVAAAFLQSVFLPCNGQRRTAEDHRCPLASVVVASCCLRPNQARAQDALRHPHVGMSAGTFNRSAPAAAASSSTARCRALAIEWPGRRSLTAAPTLV